ncbi:JAB domain-containing protein [Chitinophaga ginsengisegetis]|uniref:JAB domain-containing protein n=1 Tax=Chitinophaga ginsengisegetis TaxID=393003 RepID=A0A1T5NJ75_9BACT|nr:ThiF family adenylyltransferase [Chitinophaga ginsengisegetis]SKD00505.1 JAB domain-containing protein [Chitinophaga ginsengisegetis]
MRYTLTLLEDHLKELKKLILHPDRNERPAILLCGVSNNANDPWDGGLEVRFLSKEVIEIPDTEILKHNEIQVTWDTTCFRKAMKRAKDEGLAICLVHSHPEGCINFSDLDDINERSLFESIHKRNGNSISNLSLLITADGHLSARACSVQLKYSEIELIRVLGDRFSFFYKGKYTFQTREEFSRQALALGPALNADLSRLRIAVIGCGATGSATAHLLARLGVGHLLLIDNDLVERSNLSRLYGARTADADLGAFKSQVLASYLANIGMGCRVRHYTSWVGDEACRNPIKSCDIVFSCTDDNSGRIFLNRLAYFYLLPVFDMGISIDPLLTPDIGIRAAQGRFTVLQPHNACLICRHVVNHQLAREEELKRTDPDGFERLKQEAYVIGMGNPSPAVITFTSEVATMSVNELINRLTGFKKQGPQHHLVRFFDQGTDRTPSAHGNADCPICKSAEYWGRGDITPFLDQVN